MLGDNYPIFDDEYSYSSEELAKFAVKFDTYEKIKSAIQQYGLEGTEEVIKRVYTNLKTQESLLKILYEIWKG